ncbi:MAG: ATP-binding protein [Ginsengibacter sp.]
MIPFFRRLPLQVKLVLIGIVPLIFLTYLSFQLYKEKAQKVKLIGDYIERIHQSANINTLMNELQTERRYSYHYALTKEGHDKIMSQRAITDSIIKHLQNSNDSSLAGFTSYTFLYNLPNVRKALDTSQNFSADEIMRYYTTAIFRLNTLNSTAPASNIYLKPVYQDLKSQKTLSEMISYLGIIRTNIYNALYRRQYMVENLMGTIGTLEIYKTYETEFLLKASASSIKLYNDQRNHTALKPAMDYLDKLFKGFKFDTTFNAEHWWDVSTGGITGLRKIQMSLWHSVETRMNSIYKGEETAKNRTLMFLILTLLFVAGFVTYNISLITRMLTELKNAAREIALGGTGLLIKNIPNDVLGSLAHSILAIDKSNKQLAKAADSIGRGDFDVEIQPRSKEDLLGNSIERMKEDLQEFTLQKDKEQKETLELLNKKDEFISVVSHELKTPVTSLKVYTQILHMESIKAGDAKRENMLGRMDAQVSKLSSLINVLLDTSKLQNGQLKYTLQNFILNDLVKEVVEEMQRTTNTQQVHIEMNIPLEVYADRERIGQVLSSLLTNAIKYCDTCEEITVKAERHDGKAICSVKDLGIGIAKEEQDKIFERFYRVSGKNLHTYPGLGLGLYLSKEIIEKHIEKIWVESEEGKGSVFYFSLPITHQQ